MKTICRAAQLTEAYIALCKDKKVKPQIGPYDHRFAEHTFYAHCLRCNPPPTPRNPYKDH